MIPRAAILDTYYPDFLSTWQLNPEAGYEAELQRLLAFSFGTADYYSRNLRALGWETLDIIGNYAPLQEQWARENDCRAAYPWRIVLEQIRAFKPAVVFLQDLSFLNHESLAILKREGYLMTGQCSCPMPLADKVRQCDVLFTSFPHYLKRFQDLGVKAVYLPLAFEPDVLTRLGPEEPERDIDCLFVGGIGFHWTDSLPLLETLAREIPSMQFWGYGYENLPAGSPIRKKYLGPAWGLDYYRLLHRAKIVVNRHGAVAGPYANNLRLFEVTGCGALLFTEWRKNLDDFFTADECIAYQNPEEAARLVRHYLDHWTLGKSIAEAGQQKTLTRHTYQQRMPLVSETLQKNACNLDTLPPTEARGSR